MSAPPYLSPATPRLALRPVLEDEPVEPLARLSARVHGDADPDHPPPERVRDAHRAVARSAAAFAAHRYGLWLLVPPGAAEAIGWCGLKAGDDPAQPELMYGLVPDARGRGLATEAVRAVVALALALPRTVRVWGAALPDNAPSARVMERAGLAREGLRTLEDGVTYVVHATRGDLGHDGGHEPPRDARPACAPDGEGPA